MRWLEAAFNGVSLVAGICMAMLAVIYIGEFAQWGALQAGLTAETAFRTSLSIVILSVGAAIGLLREWFR